MLKIYDDMLDVMNAAFEHFEHGAPKPEQSPHGDGWVWRYRKPDISQALLLKLAHLLSTPNSALVLHRAGYFMQQAMLQRIADEANEDIVFLVCAVTTDSVTDLHDRFLDAFWAEEFTDPEDPVGGHKSRPMIPRKKIRAYIAAREGIPNPSAAIDVTKAVSKSYSGFVHGASTHTLECYGGSPPKFQINGMLGTPREEEYRRDLWNYMFRGFCSFIFVAKALGEEAYVRKLMEFKEHFETLAGKNYV